MLRRGIAHGVRTSTLSVLIAALTAFRVWNARGQETSGQSGPSESSSSGESTSETGQEQGASADNAVRIPYSSIFRDPTFPYSNALQAPPPLEARPSDNARAIVQTNGYYSLRLPLSGQGFNPEQADLKFGPIYFKLRAASAQLLYSDNANLTETDRVSGWIGVMRLDATVMAQLSDNLNVAIGGSLVFLPFKGEAGFGYGLRDSFLLSLLGPNLIRSQINYDTIIAGWPVVFSDDFGAGIAGYSSGVRDDFLNFEAFQAEGDRLGRYRFALPREQQGNTGANNINQGLDSSFMFFSNRISASTDRLLPGSVRLQATLQHENLWYNQGNRGLPGTRDAFAVVAASERENQRFKPFVSYELVHVGDDPGVSNTVHLGVRGPITDQLDVAVSIGYFNYTAVAGSGSLLGQLDLRHVAGPYTTEHLRLGRDVGYYRDEILDYAEYDLHQVLGPVLNAAFFTSAARYQATGSRPVLSEHEDWRTGILLSYTVSPKTSIAAGATFTYQDADGDIARVWTGRLLLSHSFTDTLNSSVLYQYQSRNGNVPDGNYQEDLVVLTLTKLYR